jgi:hypothetical protein
VACGREEILAITSGDAATALKRLISEIDAA